MNTISIAILEHADLARTETRAPREKDVVEDMTFNDDASFKAGLMASVSALLIRPVNEIKLLVISSHGIAGTGTNLVTNPGGPGLPLDDTEVATLFNPTPSNLVVYVSACFGGYPAMRAIQKGQWTPPIIVGPLVDIYFDDVNRFQKTLVSMLRTVNRTQVAVLRGAVTSLVDQFNKDDSLEPNYHGRFLFGMCDERGVYHPAESEGAQLSKPLCDYTFFRVLDIRPVGPIDKAKEVIVQDEGGTIYSVNPGPLTDLMDEHGAVETFEAAWQLNFEIPGQPARIELVKVKVGR